VLYLAGNHEYYEGEFEAVQEAMGAAARRLAVELLDCSEVVLEGVRFSAAPCGPITRSRRRASVPRWSKPRESSIRIIN